MNHLLNVFVNALYMQNIAEIVKKKSYLRLFLANTHNYIII